MDYYYHYGTGLYLGLEEWVTFVFESKSKLTFGTVLTTVLDQIIMKIWHPIGSLALNTGKRIQMSTQIKGNAVQYTALSLAWLASVV